MERETPHSGSSKQGTGALEDRAAQFQRWIVEARGGSQEALGQLLEACRGYLLSVANRDLDEGLRGKMGASDLVQETLLEAQTGIARFRGGTEDELLAWMRQILTHNAGDARRKYVQADKRRVDREEHLSDGSGEGIPLPAAIDTPSVQVSNDEQLQRMCRALAQLPQDYQRVIQMRNWQLLSFADIGTQLQRSEEAARKLWVRAIERLQEELKANDESL